MPTRLRIFILILLLELRLVINDTSCPDQFFQCGNHCYFKSNIKSIWNDARFLCLQLQPESSLVVLNNKTKDVNIRNCLQSLKFTDESWIDATFDFKQNRWIWGTNAEPIKYQSFSRRKPEDDSAWNCAFLNPTLRHRWSVGSCIMNKTFICEKLPLDEK